MIIIMWKFPLFIRLFLSEHFQIDYHDIMFHLYLHGKWCLFHDHHHLFNVSEFDTIKMVDMISVDDIATINTQMLPLVYNNNFKVRYYNNITLIIMNPFWSQQVTFIFILWPNGYLLSSSVSLIFNSCLIVLVIILTMTIIIFRIPKSLTTKLCFTPIVMQQQKNNSYFHDGR